MLIDRRHFKNFDWGLLLLILLLILVGVLIMYSATSAKGVTGKAIFADHLLRLVVGLLLMLIVLLIDYHLLTRYAYFAYVLNVGALVMVASMGVIGFGAKRWLQIGPVAVQPSEIFKITLIITLARYLSRSRKAGDLEGQDLIIPGILAMVPMGLVLIQPDLGTAGIIFLIFLTMMVMSGVAGKTWSFFFKVLLGGSAAVLASFALGFIRVGYFLKPYQLERIKVLFNPNLDPLGAGYHINQSKIAIGSGGFIGKGFLNGTQSQLRFLPQQHTDFIFSVLAEEWGFLGVLMVVTLYLLLFLRSLQIARGAKDLQGALVATGVAAMIFYHTVINIGMTVGIMPVVGLPLPLISYGGSSFLSIMLGVGLLLNVRMRRFII
jgi:rod shape determining protein RodA